MNRREYRKALAEELYESIKGAETLGESLEGALSGEFGEDMNRRYGELIIANDKWQEALNLGFNKDPRVAFRASWALEWAYFNNREGIITHLDTFKKNFIEVTNPSAHRHYSKMMCDMLRRGIITLSRVESESIAEKSFDLLINPATKVAVKVWCVEVLYFLRAEHSWISEHLEEVIEQQVNSVEATPGLKSHGLKVLKRLHKKK